MHEFLKFFYLLVAYVCVTEQVTMDEMEERLTKTELEFGQVQQPATRSRAKLVAQISELEVS